MVVEKLEPALMESVLLGVFCLFSGAATAGSPVVGMKGLSMVRHADARKDPSGPSAADPLNAVYLIEGRRIPLRNGRFEEAAAPGSATRIKTAVFGKPLFGDLNGDGRKDAALLLTQDPGGSGTFYHAAVSVNRNGAYLGTNAVFLGDRIVPRNIRIQNGIVYADFADRRPEAPMSESPTVETSIALILENGELQKIEIPGEGERIVEGRVIIGHEVRSFAPCPAGEAVWLQGSRSAMHAVKAAYLEQRAGHKPYTPLFMVLVGKVTPPPADGFGADYQGAFFTTRFVRVWPEGECSR